MTAYLRTYPPVRSQYRSPRRAKPTGSIVVHTAESGADITTPDIGAENVARFIQTRTSPGSYHYLVDSDSTILLVDLADEAYGEGTGGNRFAVHLSVACKAAQWPTLPPWWRDGAISQLAEAATVTAAWLKETHGVSVPAMRITRDDYWDSQPGFISHAELDPQRRTDPGLGFPWDRFLREYERMQPTPPPPVKDDEMVANLYAAYKTGGRAPSPAELKAWVAHLRDSGQDLTDVCLWIAETVAGE